MLLLILLLYTISFYRLRHWPTRFFIHFARPVAGAYHNALFHEVGHDYFLGHAVRRQSIESSFNDVYTTFTRTLLA